MKMRHKRSNEVKWWLIINIPTRVFHSKNNELAWSPLSSFQHDWQNVTALFALVSCHLFVHSHPKMNYSSSRIHRWIASWQQQTIVSVSVLFILQQQTAPRRFDSSTFSSAIAFLITRCPDQIIADERKKRVQYDSCLPAINWRRLIFRVRYYLKKMSKTGKDHSIVAWESLHFSVRWTLRHSSLLNAPFWNPIRRGALLLLVFAALATQSHHRCWVFEKVERKNNL